MLVLSRKIGEVIQIGDQVTVEVLEVRGGRVKLGIVAPDDVRVHRQEILDSDSSDLLGRPSLPRAGGAPARQMIMHPVGS